MWEARRGPRRRCRRRSLAVVLGVPLYASEHRLTSDFKEAQVSAGNVAADTTGDEGGELSGTAGIVDSGAARAANATAGKRGESRKRCLLTAVLNYVQAACLALGMCLYANCLVFAFIWWWKILSIVVPQDGSLRGCQRVDIAHVPSGMVRRRNSNASRTLCKPMGQAPPTHTLI